jgi:hypothetical protein
MLKFLLFAMFLHGVTFAEEPWQTHLDDVLHALALRSSDLAISKDYLSDPDRLAVTRQILTNPATSDVWVRRVSESLLQLDLTQSLPTAATFFGHRVDASMPNGELESHEDIAERVRDVSSQVRSLNLTREVLSLVALVQPDSPVGAQESDQLIKAGRSVPIKRLLELSAVLMSGLREAGSLPGNPRSYDSPFGRVTIGSTSDDLYDRSHALIIDPGGNDRYRGIAGVSSEKVPVSVVVDFSGDDVYEGAVGFGVGGIGVVIDHSGDDTYDGADTAQGVGVGGVGILLDLAGDDTYSASVAAQGFGLYGLGLLMDVSGDDEFKCELLGQGAAGPGGVGILVNGVGEDRYLAGGRYNDFREDGQYSKSMSQGFSLGLQTQASGGLGLLIDGEGGDRYEVAYFGQGASHWAGVGALYDANGSDTYVARRYAQGCGVHLSAGILVDDSGDDVYSLWGVGQGCGHDLAVGGLFDRSGDDRYEISWLGQGAGNANGTGLLIDHRGDDVYKAERNDTQGHGIAARDFGSIGILLDLEGVDTFRRPGRFVPSGTIGARYDVDHPGSPE